VNTADSPAPTGTLPATPYIPVNPAPAWRAFSARHLPWCLAFGVLGIFVLGKFLITTQHVLSHQTTDTFAQLVYTYKLGFDGLRNGDLVLWNPYNYGGQPFLGQMQSALLYPPNWLVVWLPIATALNWLIFGHQWLLALGMYGWGVSRGMKPVAAFLAGALVMFSAPFMLHIYSGHIPHLCCMAWAPFIFWGIDSWFAKRNYRWLLFIAAAAAMQIYAGHPQYFYYTAIVAGVYTLIFQRGVTDKPRALLGLLAVYPIALLFAAAQFIPGLGAASESVRGGGTSHEFASMFAFPPENIVTLVAPWLFGNMMNAPWPFENIATAPYWGRCYLWEMSLFFGAGGLMLAINGFTVQERARRWQYAILFAVVALLALGARTPLYDVLYHALPGFSMFRGTSKFGFFLVLFLVLLAGHGFNGLLEGGKTPGWLRAGALALGAGLLLGGLCLHAGWLAGGWEAVIRGLVGFGQKAGESYLVSGYFNDPAHLASAVKVSAWALVFAGFWLLACGSLLCAAPGRPRAVWGLAACAVLEVMMVAGQSVASFPLSATRYPEFKDFLAKNPGDYRTLNLINPESAIELKSEGVWGYDPFVLRRYAEFVAFSQNKSPDRASQNMQFTQNTPLLALLRARLAFVPGENGTVRVQPLQDPLPRFYVVANHRVLKGRDEIFAEMAKPGFNPRNEVLLEETPILAPDPGAGQYSIRLLNRSTDHWTLEVSTQFSAFLVMTDAYSKDWRVRSLPDPTNPTLSSSVQVSYELLPAYHALRAIPLAPGLHRIRIEYSPAGFGLGVRLTLVSLIAACLFLFVPCFRAVTVRLTVVREKPVAVNRNRKARTA
jgi:hypothetical protein